jgi:hypothetical protein
MSINPQANNQQPDSGPPSPVQPTVILIMAAAFATVAGYYTGWDTAVEVFLAIIALFNGQATGK